MRQLGELNRNAAKFDELGVEIIAVFREEKKGIDGLQMIKDNSKVPFTLAIDLESSKTSAYSNERTKQFANYVISGTGKVVEIIDGSLKNRAKSEQLLTAIKKTGATEAPNASKPAGNDKASVNRAILDYVEGIYEVKPDLIKRGVHPDLQKFGFYRPKGDEKFSDGSAMTFDQLVKLAGEYNADGKRIPKDAPKEIVIFDVLDKTASAKLTAAWGVDFFHLVKNKDGIWQIRQVLWQSPSKK